MYSYSPIPLNPTQSPYNTKSSHLPPTAYAPLATSHSHHLAQTPTHHTYPTSIPPNSTPAPILLQPTRPDSRQYPQHSVHYPTPRHTLPPPNPYPPPLPHLNPTHLSHHAHSAYYRALQTLTPHTPYAQPAAKTRISPSNAHMSLGRFCCALTIEYKCKTSNINKRL